MARLNRIAPCLWFDNQAEEAANFYVSIFPDSRIRAISRYGKEGFEFHGKPEGSVLNVEFELDGQLLNAVNGGPIFHFTEAISLAIQCDSQQEIDHFWDKLSAGGEIQQCGWLKDKYGLSWQVTPAVIGRMIADSEPEKAARVMAALFGMKKLDLAALQRAYDG